MKTSWKVAILSAVVWLLATTIQDQKQNSRIAELQRRVEAIAIDKKTRSMEEREKRLEEMTEKLRQVNAKLDAIENDQRRKGIEQ